MRLVLPSPITLLALALLVPLAGACAGSAATRDDVATSQTSDALTSAEMIWSATAPTTPLDLQLGPNTLSVTQTGAANMNTAYQVQARAGGYELAAAATVTVRPQMPPTEPISCAAASVSVKVLGSTGSSTYAEVGHADVQGTWVTGGIYGFQYCNLTATVDLSAHPHLYAIRVMAQAKGHVYFNLGALPVAMNAIVTVNATAMAPAVDPGKKMVIKNVDFTDHAYTFEAYVGNVESKPAYDVVTTVTGTYKYCDTTKSGCSLSTISQCEGGFCPPGLIGVGQQSQWPAPKVCNIVPQTTAPISFPGLVSYNLVFQDFTSPECPKCDPKNSQLCADIELTVSTHTVDAKQPGEPAWDVASASASFLGVASWNAPAH